jgi:hypothetical protein
MDIKLLLEGINQRNRKVFFWIRKKIKKKSKNKLN